MPVLARLGGLTTSGKARVAVAWALYDFANTIFSFAVVSSAIGLWLVSPARFGERDGNFVLSVAVVVSVGLNALVSPILGALSDRGGRRLPYLLFFTALCIVPTVFIGQSPAMLGVVLFVIANFAYQAALIYYDASLKSVSRPATRGRLSGIRVAVGYMGTIFAGLFLLMLVFVKESGPIGRISAADILGSLTQLRTSIGHAREVPGLLRFLVARFFYS